MFGYLQIQKSELKVREYEAYKSVYCGLCKQLGRDYSFLARLILSYDCTFYAMLIMSLNRTCAGFNDGRCRFNPLKKCKFADCSDNSYSKAAALSVISAYYKLRDTLLDSGFLKRIAVRLIMPLFSHWRKKAAKRYSWLETAVADMMKKQYDIERGGSAPIDFAAHPTAEMLGNILAHEGKNESDSRVLREYGYQLGRWIYLIDAADDLEKDVKRKNFNPFADLTRGNKYDYISSALNQSLARAYDAYNLIDIKDFKGILDNMMLLGFPSKQKAVTEKLREVKND